MQRILSVLKGEAEHSIMNIDGNKWFIVFYDFEVVEKGLREPHLSLLKLRSVFDKPHIKPGEIVALREFQQS